MVIIIIAAKVHFMQHPVSKRLVNPLSVMKLKIPCKTFYSIPDALIILNIDLLITANPFVQKYYSQFFQYFLFPLPI